MVTFVGWYELWFFVVTLVGCYELWFVVVTFVGWYECRCVVVTFVGWYQGERIRDGERGWFPGNYTTEVASAHVRARNLKQRYRLLALSENFLETQHKGKQAN